MLSILDVSILIVVVALLLGLLSVKELPLQANENLTCGWPVPERAAEVDCRFLAMDWQG